MQNRTFNRLVWLGVVLFALAFFAAGAWLAAARARRAESLTRTKGTVVEVKSYSSGPGGAASTGARVRYRTRDGQTVEFTGSLPNRSYGEGGEVPVLYDPRSPQQAEIDVGRWVEPAILFFVGTIPLLSRLIWAFKDRKERARRRRKGIPDVEERMTYPSTSRRPKLPR